MRAQEVLSVAVEITVGAGAAPRPGQARMCDDISEALDARGQLVGVGPTGVGKSYAILASAAHRAADYNERTVISTDSLSLQAQIVTKDAPVVIDSVRRLGGRELSIVVVKGYSNYADPRALLTVARLIAGQPNETDFIKLAQAVSNATVTSPVLAELGDIDIGNLLPLIVWGLGQYADPELQADRDSYAGTFTDPEWQLVSSSSKDRAPDDFVPTPKATLARAAAAVADIVVINHTLLGLRAATGLPIVLGGKKLGEFDHVIVDEAHTLPDKVRDQGAVEFSGSSLNTVMRNVRAVGPDTLKGADLLAWLGKQRAWLAAGESLAKEVERVLAGLVAGVPGGVKGIEPEADVLAPVGGDLLGWLAGVELLTAAAAASKGRLLSLRVSKARTSAAKVGEVFEQLRTHGLDSVRWVRRPPTADPGDLRPQFTALCVSVVDVSELLRDNVWTTNGSRLSAVLVSATIPRGFAASVGVTSDVEEYESPFAVAYAGSAAYMINS